jgi:hypothetical protein
MHGWPINHSRGLGFTQAWLFTLSLTSGLKKLAFHLQLEASKK